MLICSLLQKPLFRRNLQQLIRTCHLPNTSVPYPLRPYSTRPKQSLWQRIKGIFRYFFMDPTIGEGFVPEEIEKRYVRDKVSPAEWLLIYNDRASTVLYAVISYGLVCGFTMTGLLALDYWRNDGNLSIKGFDTLLGDAVQLGWFWVVPVAILSVILAFIIRLQRLRIMQIYMKRTDPKQYRVCLAGGPFSKNWRNVDRADFEPSPLLYEDTSSFKVLIFGNFRIRGRRGGLLLSEDAFRENNFQTYMLGVTQTVPKKLATLDLPSESLEENSEIRKLD